MSSVEESAGESQRRRVVVVGSANQDLTAYTGQVPTMGQTVLGKSFETSCGGKGANQAVAAASLDICPVSMVCRVGSDSFGTDLLGNFQDIGVQYDASTTIVKTTGTGVAPIVVDTNSGDNMIIVIPGANFALTPEEVRKAILDLVDQGEAPAVVIAQLEILPETALEALKVGKEVGAITILNPAPAPEGWDLNEFFPFADIIIPNETELQSLCGGSSDADEEAMAKSLFEKGVGKAVVVTLGARGAMVVAKSEDDDTIEVTPVSAPEDLPCRNDPVEDTVGAGDSFCGALSVYLSAGLSLSEAAGKACGVASMSVRKRGAQTSYPKASELPECLRLPAMSSSTKSKPAITFVTGNKKKLEEVQRILSTSSELAFEIDNKKIDLPELQGDPVDIAKEKCRLAAQEVKGPVLTEDTSLCFNALQGMPGPYIKWFLEKCGHDGLNDMLTGFDDKTGYAQTVVAFTTGPGKEIHVFDGRTSGKIVRPRGSLDFGWDPIFEPDESDGQTYAEMTKDDKNKISHRGRSFAKLRSFLTSNADDIISSL